MAALPTWAEFMVPILRTLSDGQVRTLRELRRQVADTAELTDEQRAEQVSSGSSRAESRISWAASFLTRVDALERPRRGHYAITDFGRNFLNEHPAKITEKDLRAVAKEGDEWWTDRARSLNRVHQVDVELSMTPTEQVDDGIARIHQEVAAELLVRLQRKAPEFFEEAVVELLLAMGYGGATGGGSVTQLSNDGGIDGIIDQDVLGLSRVYIQAKRYSKDNPVQRPAIHAFVGALSGKADSGVFITTSRFTKGATVFAESAAARIILIDGKHLADLMIRYGVGVQVRQTHRIVTIDEDFFE